MFVIKDEGLADMIDSSKGLWAMHEGNRPYLRRQSAEARKTIEALSHIPGGLVGAWIEHLKFLLRVRRAATWVGVTQCESCNALHIADSNEPKALRFICEDCGDGWCVFAHVEGSRKRADTAYETSLADYQSDPTEGMDAKQLEKWERAERERELARYTNHESLSRKGHRNFVKRHGCSIKKQGARCPQCDGPPPIPG